MFGPVIPGGKGKKTHLYNLFVVEKTHVFPAINFTTIFSNKFMFGKTHVFLTISFPDCGSYFFLWLKKLTFFQLFSQRPWNTVLCLEKLTFF